MTETNWVRGPLFIPGLDQDGDTEKLRILTSPRIHYFPR